MFDVSKETLAAVRAFLMKDGDGRGVKAPQRKPNPRGMLTVRRILRARRLKRQSGTA